jgi:hypothetical protein
MLFDLSALRRLAVVVLPIHDNDGKSFPDSLLQEFRHDLHELSGGFTYFSAHGEWRGEDGRTYHDSNIRFEIAEPDFVELRLLLADWAKRLGQECVYLETRFLDSVEFIKPVVTTPDEPASGSSSDSRFLRIELNPQQTQQRKETTMNKHVINPEDSGIGPDDDRPKHEGIRPRGRCAGHLRHPRECSCGRSRALLRHGRRFRLAAACSRCLRANAASSEAHNLLAEAKNE